MNLQLEDKVAVVTGSSRGLGLASAAALLKEGCRVAICARGAERLKDALAELRATCCPDAPERVMAVAVDLATA